MVQQLVNQARGETHVVIMWISLLTRYTSLVTVAPFTLLKKPHCWRNFEILYLFPTMTCSKCEHRVSFTNLNMLFYKKQNIFTIFLNFHLPTTEYLFLIFFVITLLSAITHQP